MGLDNLGEFGFIDRIKRSIVNSDNRIIKGIGDDCAVIKSSGEKAILFTTDILVEDIDFIRELTPAFKLGRKSLAVSLSDIAAMGGTPRDAVISAAIPRRIPLDYLDAIFAGIKSMAQEFDVNIVGGDTSGSPDKLVINIALTGEACEDEILYRSGAKPGDILFLTGYVGASAAGLHAIKANHFEQKWQGLIEQQTNPLPHITAGRLLSGLKLVHALIDVSDGLASDLNHICEESGVGGVIHEDSIPVSDSASEYIRIYSLDYRKLALFTGEDYILLGTMPSDTIAMAREALKSSGWPFFIVGEIIEGKGISLKTNDGSIEEIQPLGFDHFKT